MLLPHSFPKGGEVDGKNDKGRGGKRESRIVLIQRKVGKLGNQGRMTGWTHRAALVKSSKVHNLGFVKYEKVDEQGKLISNIFSIV